MYDFFPPLHKYHFFLLASKPTMRYVWTFLVLVTVGMAWYFCVYAKLITTYAEYEQLYQAQLSLAKTIKVLEKEQSVQQDTYQNREHTYQEIISRSGNPAETIFALLHHATVFDLIINSYTNVRDVHQAAQTNYKKRTLAFSLSGSFENMRGFLALLDNYFVHIDHVHLKKETDATLKMDIRLDIIELKD